MHPPTLLCNVSAYAKSQNFYNPDASFVRETTLPYINRFLCYSQLNQSGTEIECGKTRRLGLEDCCSILARVNTHNMSCCGGGEVAGAPKTQTAVQSLPYKYLFKYIIVGDTGVYNFAPNVCYFLLRLF